MFIEKEGQSSKIENNLIDYVKVVSMTESSPCEYFLIIFLNQIFFLSIIIKK